LCFFFQAEDGIRDGHVTGVQTCALPICRVLKGEALASDFVAKGEGPKRLAQAVKEALVKKNVFIVHGHDKAAKNELARLITDLEIGRASCRERVEISVGEGGGEKEREEQ